MLGDLERGFERFVDSAIARGFRLRVQPAEIGRQLERAMLDGVASSVGGVMAPNAFAVTLHPDDAAQFDGWADALCLEMERWLADLAFRRGLVTVAPIQVTLRADSEVRRRSVRATAQFVEGARNEQGHSAADVMPLVLCPLDDGAMPEMSVRTRATLGRAAGNNIMIDDELVSRRHAILEFQRGTWQISDLDSTNGTWLNGRPVRRAQLADGDEIQIGQRRYRVRLK